MRALILTISLALLATSAAGARTAPTVRITSAAPLTVAGTSFTPRERLRIVARFDGIRKVRYPRATASGRFTVRLLNETVTDRCSVRVSVVRANGRTIAAKLPAALCPAPLTGAP